MQTLNDNASGSLHDQFAQSSSNYVSFYDTFRAIYCYRGGFLCFSLTRGRVRGRHSFGVPLNMKGGLTRTPHGKNTHRTRECAVLSTNEHERGPHGGPKCIKARARTEKTLYTLPGRYLAPLFLKNATEIRYRFAFLSCSVCFFFDLSASCIRP